MESGPAPELEPNSILRLRGTGIERNIFGSTTLNIA
jgi:hypothetical protein